jgi:translocator protein
VSAGTPGSGRRTLARAGWLLGCVGVSALPGVIGSQFEPGAWYASIEKASLTPPSWVFPVVWPVLYLMMGISLWRFLESDAPRQARVAGVTLFGVQLVLNGLWSYLFFGLHMPGLALVEIALLWLTIGAVIAVFSRPARGAAWLLVPYLMWVSFATYLNFEVWRLQ